MAAARVHKPVANPTRPAMAAEDGFFSRWSRRKAQADAPARAPAPAVPTVSVPVPAVPPTGVAAQAAAPAPAPVAAQLPEPGASPPPAAPTLADVAQLTPQSDFAPYMGRTVAQAVKNAAMKKLFADPHFNVMDGLDIYIDDYSIPSPLSAEERQRMVAAQFIKLVDEPKPTVAATDAATAATTHARPEVPHSPSAAPTPCAPDAAPDTQARPPTAHPDTPHGTAPHDHPDLQLQPDDAAQRPGAEPGA